MKFAEWETCYARAVKRTISEQGMPANFNAADYREAWYQNAVSLAAKRRSSNFDEAAAATCLLASERLWLRHKRPYYNVWPSVCQSLCRLPLNIDATAIHLPVPELLVRFPLNAPLRTSDGISVFSMLVVNAEMPKTHAGTAIVISMDYMRDGDSERKVAPYLRNLVGGKTVEDCLHLVEFSWNVEMVTTCVRLFCTLCLLGDNPDIIRPDVLEQHRAKYDETHDPKYVAKAIQRGKIGWDVGRDLEPEIVRGEVSPHYRRPHFGIRYCGEGGKIPRVVPIKGTVVRRGKLCEVPTGYLDAESV